MNKIRLFLATLGLLPILSFAPAMAVSNNPLDSACQTNAKTRASAVCQQSGAQGTTNPIAGPNGIISKAANIFALLAGISAVAIIIISGFMFVTAGGASPGQRSGDPNKVKSARAALSGSVVGLVIIAMAWAIVRFITDVVIK